MTRLLAVLVVAAIVLGFVAALAWHDDELSAVFGFAALVLLLAAMVSDGVTHPADRDWEGEE